MSSAELGRLENDFDSRKSYDHSKGFVKLSKRLTACQPENDIMFFMNISPLILHERHPFLVMRSMDKILAKQNQPNSISKLLKLVDFERQEHLIYRILRQ